MIIPSYGVLRSTDGRAFFDPRAILLDEDTATTEGAEEAGIDPDHFAASMEKAEANGFVIKLTPSLWALTLLGHWAQDLDAMWSN